ncbi:MAG TPA: hypothetical protein QGF58_07690 [Myxococcota bacterium]|nr:hypothetical protein [Myxococcota bacterium]
MLTAFLAPSGIVFRHRNGLAPVADGEFSVATQVQLSASDRPDMQVKADGFVLLVECKVDAPYDRGQVERYLAHVDGVPEGGVVAIVPRRSVPPVGDTPSNDRFLGFVAWEDVAALLVAIEPAGDARDGFRSALVNLLDSYGLVPFDGEVAPWELPDGTQDVEQVRLICSVLNAAAADVGADPTLMARAPHPYRAALVTTSTLLSGSGPTPRPILWHATALRSFLEPESKYRYFAFLDAVVVVTFQSATANEGSDRVVEFFVDTRPVPRAGGTMRWLRDDDEFLRAVLSAGPWDIPEDAVVPAATQAVAEMRAGYEAVVRRVAALLDSDYPAARVQPWDSWGVRIVFGSTEEWIAPGEGLADLRVRYASLLRDVFGALFESEPDRPLGRLLTAVTCADR